MTMTTAKLFCGFLLVSVTTGFTTDTLKRQCLTPRSATNENNNSDDSSSMTSTNTRRSFLVGTTTTLLTTTMTTTSSANAVERAVGAYEQKCREEGNCLEIGDFDGAVGWNWGAKDRCDATDPKCGNGGQLSADAIAPEAVPPLLEKTITHKVTMTMTVGKAETGTLTFGLYGQDAPKAVQQMVEFLSPGGLETNDLLKSPGGSVSQAVSLATGYSLVTGISPNEQILLGIPSQAALFARSNGLSKAGDSFVPQNRPPAEDVKSEASVRPHSCAGLISIPSSGLGYDNSFAPEDEAFATAFSITAGATPNLDKQGRKVIGQVLDADSMAFLARLAKLPTNKGLKGVIPGQNYGPPLLKVAIKGIDIVKQSS